MQKAPVWASAFLIVCFKLSPVQKNADNLLFEWLFTTAVYSFDRWSELQIKCVKFTQNDTACVISSPNPMFDHLLESSHWDDSNKGSNIGWNGELGIKGI